MGIRDRLSIKLKDESENDSEPIWVASGTLATRELFNAAKLEFHRISSLAEKNDAKNIKDKKLVLSRIAKIANKDRSLLNSRRQPELCNWISRKNQELEIIFKANPFPKNKNKTFSKRQLERELSMLRKKIKIQNENEYRVIVEAFFESNLLDDRDKLVRENSQLKLENEQLIDKITRLQHSNREYINTIAHLMSNLSPKQRASLKGWDVPNEFKDY